MKVWKLVSGIICCVLSIIVLSQSYIASIGEALIQTNTSEGGAGMLVAFIMLAGGIVSIATFKNKKNGANIALIVLFFLGTIIGFTNATYYKDLSIWAIWCLICEVGAVVIFVLSLGKGHENID